MFGFKIDRELKSAKEAHQHCLQEYGRDKLSNVFLRLKSIVLENFR
jgi:hypothetical protein